MLALAVLLACQVGALACREDPPKRLVATCRDRTQIVEQYGKLWLVSPDIFGDRRIELAPEVPLANVCHYRRRDR